MQVIPMLDWLVEAIPKFLLAPPIDGLLGLMVAVYILSLLFRR